MTQTIPLVSVPRRSPTPGVATDATGAAVIARSSAFDVASRSSEALGRLLLHADFEPLVFFIGVFFLWIHKHLYTFETLRTERDGVAAFAFAPRAERVSRPRDRRRASMSHRAIRAMRALSRPPFLVPTRTFARGFAG